MSFIFCLIHDLITVILQLEFSYYINVQTNKLFKSYL